MILKNTSNVEYSYVLPDHTTETVTGNSNEAITEILTDEISLIKSSDSVYLKEGEKAKQKVVITNNSKTSMTNQFFKDVMTGPADYVLGSVVINGASFPGHDLVAGFALPDLAVGQSHIVEYEITAQAGVKGEQISNSANLDFTVGGCDFNQGTNTVVIDTLKASLVIVKTVDKEYAVSGDKLHYTNTITNDGSVEKTNITFKDIIPAGTSFVSGSVIIDGVAQSALNPITGFALADIPVGAQIVVEFDVTVD